MNVIPTTMWCTWMPPALALPQPWTRARRVYSLVKAKVIRKASRSSNNGTRPLTPISCAYGISCIALQSLETWIALPDVTVRAESVTKRYDLPAQNRPSFRRRRAESGSLQQLQPLVRRPSVKATAAHLVSLVFAPTPPQLVWPATAVRIGAGAIFVGFGLSKFTQHGRETRAFDRYGLPDPAVFAYATGTLEIALGAMLVLGLLTRLAALGMAGNMIGAIATGGRVDGGFVNLVLAPILLVAMLFLLRAGGGRWSLDDRLPRFTHPPPRPQTVTT